MLYTENPNNKYQIILTDSQHDLWNWIFNWEFKNWIFEITFDNLKIWIFFDTNFWLQKKSNKDYQKLYLRIKQQKKIKVLKDRHLTLMQLERNWNYWINQEQAIINNYFNQINSQDSHTKWILIKFAEYSLHFFNLIYKFILELKTKYNNISLEEILKKDDEIDEIFDKQFISKQIILLYFNYFNKLYKKININNWTHKTPWLWDWILANTAIINNIWHFPNNNIIISEDEDIFHVSNIVANYVIPNFLITLMVNYYILKTHWKIDESWLNHFINHLQIDWIDYNIFLNDLWKELEKFWSLLFLDKNFNEYYQIVSIYNPKKWEVINQYISKILFESLILDKNTLDFLVNSCFNKLRLSRDFHEIYFHKWFKELMIKSSKKWKILHLTKRQLIEEINNTTKPMCKKCEFKTRCNNICIIWWSKKQTTPTKKSKKSKKRKK